MWQCGEHRVICGDCTDSGVVERLMQGEKADLIFTDPPYRAEVEGGSDQPIGRAAAKLGEKIESLCNFDPIGFLETLPSFFNGKMNAYMFCNKDLVPDYLNYAKEKRYNFNILFWKKPAGIPLGGQHRPDVEYLILMRKNACWNNAVPGVNYSKCLEYGRESGAHPTIKPLQLVINEISISSPNGGIVVDPFLGSGTTLIACEQLGRTCYGMEISPQYCDVIVNRWEKLTGKKAKLVGDISE
jgi:site-specific DNA-methyltransferase (adenine-specific)